MKNNVSENRGIFMCVDGWGVAQNYHNYSAIIRGNTPNYDQMIEEYPNTLLIASENMK